MINFATIKIVAGVLISIFAAAIIYNRLRNDKTKAKLKKSGIITTAIVSQIVWKERSVDEFDGHGIDYDHDLYVSFTDHNGVERESSLFGVRQKHEKGDNIEIIYLKDEMNVVYPSYFTLG